MPCTVAMSITLEWREVSVVPGEQPCEQAKCPGGIDAMLYSLSQHAPMVSLASSGSDSFLASMADGDFSTEFCICEVCLGNTTL